MINLRLLVTTGDFSKWHSRSFHYLLLELSQMCELKVCYHSGDIKQIIAEAEVTPDFIMINEYGETNSPLISGLSDLTIPWAVYMYDLHHKVEERKQAMERDRVKHVFTHYRDKFYEWYPEFWEMMNWLPLHAYTPVFRDYGLEKKIDYLLMGAVHETIYPLRYKMAQTMINEKGFVHHPHAGYRNFSDDEDALVGENYAREINRAKIFFTCDSLYQYPVPKYFEVLACNTLLLASASRELFDLGFQPGLNFIEVHEGDILEKARFYLHHESERLKVARQGYEMVRTFHSTNQRAMDLVLMIKRILKHY